MLSRLELETFCVESRRDNHYTTDLKISASSSKFISNVGLTRNKVLDLNFNQVKKNFILSKKLALMLSRLDLEPYACYAAVLTVTPQHLAISASSSKFISNVGLTRNKMHHFKFNQVKTSFCQTLSLLLSRLELEPYVC